MAVLCFAGNSLWANESNTDSITTDTNDIKSTGVIATPIDTVHGIVYADSCFSDTLRSEGKCIVLQGIQQEWYDAYWMHMLVLVLLAVLVLTTIGTYIWLSRCCSINDAQGIVMDNIRKLRRDIDLKISNIRMNEISKLESRIKKIENSNSIHVGNDSKQENGKIETTLPLQETKQNREKKNKHQKQAPAQSLRKKYAVQDASNRNRLMNVKDEFDKYGHTFEIILDSGSETDGSFTIIEDESIIQDCLNNTDSLLCCTKIGNGLKITKQVPGRVHIDGNIAEVKTPAEIHVQ